MSRLISEYDTPRPAAPFVTSPAAYASSRTKWLFDVSIALVALMVVLVSAPFILVANLFNSPGPLIFRQTRIGKDGLPFTLYKFRSMNVAKPGSNSDSRDSEESRISLVGRILRKIHLDEFPQVLNVLKGDMSIVGPRPYMEEECVQLAADVVRFESRHTVKPGITGLAQINYNHANSGREARKKLSLDFIYIKRCSLLLDIMIIAKTAWHAITLRGV